MKLGRRHPGAEDADWIPTAWIAFEICPECYRYPRTDAGRRVCSSGPLRSRSGKAAKMISALSNFSKTNPAPVSNDSVTKLSQLPHETRRLSHGPVDGVVAAWHRIDAIDANLKFRKLQKQTLSQRRFRSGRT